MRCFDATVSVVRRVSEDGTFTALTASPKLYFCACVGVKNGLVLLEAYSLRFRIP